MLALERREAILELMRAKQAVTVDELSAHFYISGATIRRDLDKMAREGLVKRTYGGAVLLDGRTAEMPLLLREGENSAAKERIAQAAARLIRDGSTLFLDSSTTAARLIPLLAGFKGLTVVTNSLKAGMKLCEYSGVSAFFAGGRLRENSGSVVGTPACRFFEAFNADLMLFSCRGVSLRKGVTEASEEEADLKRQMLKNARVRALLCDSSKFDSVYLCNLCRLEDINLLITDRAFGPEEAALLAAAGVEYLCV